MRALEESDVRAYYSVALAALRFVEQRRPTGRRFGGDADARWSSFRGDLETTDRLDLLIRDADAEWLGAFGARTTFARSSVAEDDAFGAHWASLEPVPGEELWRGQLAAPPPKDLEAVIRAWSGAWELPVAKFDVGAVEPADKLVVAGPSAIAAALRVFVKHPDLSWPDQVCVIASPPSHRQLAALGAALVNTPRATTLYAAPQAPSGVHGRRVVSPDASPEDAGAARAKGR